jgi:hypothetical protein
MSAECDGRQVSRRNGPRDAAAKRGSPQRAWRMPGAAEEVPLRVEPQRDRRAPGTAPVGPEAPFLTGTALSCTPTPENHGPR